MHLSLYRLTSSDSIRAQIQRYEIDKLIMEQKRRQDEQNGKINQISLRQIKNSNKEGRRKISSLPLSPSRKK